MNCFLFFFAKAFSYKKRFVSLFLPPRTNPNSKQSWIEELYDTRIKLGNSNIII